MENSIYVLGRKDQFLMFKKANASLPFTFKPIFVKEDIDGLQDFRFIKLSSWTLIDNGLVLYTMLKNKGKELRSSDLSDKKIFYMN